ncbi:MAG TPA: transposase, partial [Odoribacter splanchnicus]
MAKVQNISEIHPTLGFTEFDIIEKYRKSFHESELGRLHSVFPFERMAKTMGLSEQRLGRRNIFSPSAKIALMVLKAYTGFSDRQLVEHLNGNIHYQMFCWIMINPSFPITNYKIVSAIRNEIASRLDVDSLQEVLASHWKPYLDSLHVCMADATCYESHMRYPTDMKLLW